MSTCWTCADEEEREARRLNAQIEKLIRLDRSSLRKQLKLLLLGTGEAGKSTIVKQMQIIHGGGFSTERRQQAILHVHSNILESIQVLVAAMRALEIRFQHEENYSLYQQFADLEPMEPRKLEPSQLADIAYIWRDRGIQAAYEDRREFQLSDSTKYFMDKILEIAKNEYLPNNDDILRVRIRTTAIEEYSFMVKDAVFRIIDVGGQRTERRKWIYCFENVAAIFFIASLSEFDQSLFENPNENRMNESLDLFRVIINHGPDDSYLGIFFQRAAMILFLNKTDIFAEKILTSHLHNYFDDYEGPNRDAEAGQMFILQKYLARRQDQNRPIYQHFTCATDTKQVDFVFNAVRLSVLIVALGEFNPF